MNNEIEWAQLERLMFDGLEAMRVGDVEALRKIIANEKPALREALGGQFDDVIDWGDQK